MFGIPIPSLTEIKLIAITVAFLGTFLGGVAMEHKIAAGRYNALVAAQAKANLDATNKAVAEQRRLDGIALSAAQKENAAQKKLATVRQEQLAKVQKHVHDLKTHRLGCLTLGFVRVLDSAARGLDSDALVLPAGKSDDTCAPADAAAVARSIVDNYGSARANGEQLDALIDAYRASKK